ncbi:MAG: hypothetical protein HY001_02220 [Candidatus Portnoybacteria bacterium]|nr:hypothetical protein [Candidatus Portnoybacteria bacterium]
MREKSFREPLWEEQQSIFEKIHKCGSIQEYITREVPDIKKAFALGDKNLRCIDERTPGGYHLAGSGILLPLEKAIEIAQGLGIDGVWRHKECGAESLFAQMNNVDPQQAEEEIENRAQKLASHLNIPRRGTLEVEPKGLHIARVSYYIGIGEFNPSLVKNLPPGFIVSRRHVDAGYAKKELDISIGIALGEHGFGKLFTQQNPFIIIPIADPSTPEFSLETLTQEAKEVAQKGEYRGRVIVDGFIAKNEF